ncbi:Uncharacterized protein SCF082_LOCUS32032 [Durusdinium trenchii]|uniref:Uncharacterized protein n=1 Tax=Durusdinium trenchii TaxID=1381693 RepID=A0ABP0NDQ2_9DINO
MKSSVVLVLVLALSAAHVQASVQKVLGLLKEMKSQGEDALEKEEKQHADYTAFCEKTLSEKDRAIEEGTERIERLKADIEKFEASVTTLTSELQAHQKEIEVAQQDSEKNTALRQQEESDYSSTHQEYQESIRAIGEALELLKAQKDSEAEAAMAQLKAKLGKKLEVLLQGPTKAYDFQSQGVVEMLEKLQVKFSEEKEALETLETSKKSSHQQVMDSLAKQVTTASEAQEEKTLFKSKAQQSLATAKTDLEEAESTLAEDVKYKKDLSFDCQKKATEFASNQKLRREELEAIEKASEIIAGKTVAGAQKHLESGGAGLTSKAAAELIDSADKVHIIGYAELLLAEAFAGRAPLSPQLSVLIQRLRNAEAGKNETLQGVREVLQKYLANLEAERRSEIEHEGFCQKELSLNNRTRKQKTAKIESLTAEIQQLQSSVAKLAEDIAEASSQITELSTALSEATRLRSDEKAQNRRTLFEAQAAQEAVTEALKLLQDAFEKSEGISFVQENSKTGVVKLLETVLGDFSRLEAETKAQENAAEQEFKTFKADSNADKASKQTDAEHFDEKKSEQSRVLAQKEADLASSEAELESAEQYHKELAGQCLSSDSEAALQKAHREEEIQNLKTALKELEQ